MFDRSKERQRRRKVNELEDKVVESDRLVQMLGLSPERKRELKDRHKKIVTKYTSAQRSWKQVQQKLEEKAKKRRRR